MYDVRNEIQDYISSIEFYKQDINLYRPDSECELMHFSYGLTALNNFLNKIYREPTISVRFLLERTLSELNTLLYNSKDEDQKMMYSIQIDFLTDLYDTRFLC